MRKIKAYDTIVAMNKQEIAVVTGGAGFIGSHLSEKLLDLGCSVFCLDNLSTGNLSNIDHLHRKKQFTFIQTDVTESLPKLPPVDYVFHLASPASVIDYQQFPEETALVNTVGTRNMLQFTKKDHQTRFLYASTSEIYGDPVEHPQTENYWGNVNPVGVRACYDESKRWGEMITMLYFRKYHMDTRIIRIFNTYGPKMRSTDGRVVSNFINQAIQGSDITVYGSGNQTRSFCYVSDLVDGIITVMFKGKISEVYNVGNPEEYSMNELANRIKIVTNSNSLIRYCSLPEDDPEKRKPDISKIKRLGWKPKINLAEGLEKTIEYYRSK